MAYAVIGWIYEVSLEVVVYRWGFSNRGFLFGPYLPVYGFGAIIILLALQPLKKKRITLGKINVTPILVFLGVVALTTGLEIMIALRGIFKVVSLSIQVFALALAVCFSSIVYSHCWRKPMAH